MLNAYSGPYRNPYGDLNFQSPKTLGLRANATRSCYCAEVVLVDHFCLLPLLLQNPYLVTSFAHCLTPLSSASGLLLIFMLVILPSMISDLGLCAIAAKCLGQTMRGLEQFCRKHGRLSAAQSSFNFSPESLYPRQGQDPKYQGTMKQGDRVLGPSGFRVVLKV